MHDFKYIHGQTTDIEIIDYVLELMTEYHGQPNVAISVYCHIVGQPFDNKEMIDKVAEKLLKYDLAQTDLNVHGVVKITNKGREVYRNGGFAKFLETQQQIEIQEKANKDYKGQLEVLKLELETDKLTYEKTLRQQKEEIDTLNKLNLKLKIGAAIFAVISFLIGVISSNFFTLSNILKPMLTK